ncbi:MAG: DUF3109 family protein [Bacteroidales bacterium]|jgi:hypothetical protein|nr:DUF3109 family protein [Bacteroidales bacterium]
MLAVDNTLISDDIFSQYFCCDLSCCKGICCVEGDAGAPLNEEEIAVLEDYTEKIIPYMTDEGIAVIRYMGMFDYDETGHLVTPLVRDRDCAFVYYEDNIAKCAIEKAYLNGDIDFKKPVSCHLYPVRITEYAHYDALNYHQWEVCQSARKKGKELQITVFDFLKEPLSRRYGKEWLRKVEKLLSS